jgi:catalase-peroxidase
MSDESKMPFSGHKSKPEVTVGGDARLVYIGGQNNYASTYSINIQKRSNPLGKRI